jgi:hypothetical protein
LHRLVTDSIDEVDKVRVLSEAELAGLLDRLLAVEWPVPADRIRALIEQWGWSIDWADDEGSSFEADPGFGLASKSLAEFDEFEGFLASITVSTSDYVHAADDISRAALQDAFAQHAAVAQRRLGKPARRNQGGEVVSVIFDLESGARVQIARSQASCWVEIDSPEEGQLLRDSGE